jgi:WD40 repeat protein
MTFRPSPGDELAIGDHIYCVAEHPAAPGMAYGQAGRRGTVYQLIDEEGHVWALKVFQRQYREPRLAGQAERIRDFASYPGLRACERKVLTSTQYVDLIRDHMELAYAVLMPWIPGKTWMEVIVGEEVLSREKSLGIVWSLLHILAKMEERGMAHCDLSGPNVILTLEGGIELVDLEEMYAPGLIQPKALPGGSPGYAHKTAPEGLWCDEADRFAGAVMICEMLGWSDMRVREGAWGEGYFKPEEMQTHCDRFQLFKSVLSERWGDRIASLFKVAWFSDTLSLCPTFTEWLAVLPEEVPEETVQKATKIEVEKPLVSDPFVEDVEKSVAEEIEPCKDEALEGLGWIEVPHDLAKDEAVADKETWECPVCGKQVAESMKLCPYCEQGTPLLLEEGILEPVTVAQEEIEKKGVSVGKRTISKTIPWVGGGLVVLGVVLSFSLGVGGTEISPTSIPDQESIMVGVSAGSGSSTITPTEAIPSATFEPTALPTIEPSPTPLPDFPVRMGTAIPIGEVITTENVQNLEPLAILSYGLPRDMAYSPDGSELAIATDIGVLRLDAETLKEKDYFSAMDLRNIDWSEDGRYIAAGKKDGEIIVWDVNSEEQIWEWEGYPHYYSDIAISPDGSWLIAPSESTHEEVEVFSVWDMEKGTKLNELEFPRGWNGNFSLTEDGTVLALDFDNVLFLIDTNSWTTLKTLQVSSYIAAMQLSPNGEFTFITTKVGNLHTHQLMKTYTGQMIFSLGTSTTYAYDSAISKDGEKVAVINTEGNVHIWDTSLGQSVLAFKGTGSSSSAKVEFSPDEEFLATIDSGGVHLWRIDDGTELVNTSNKIYWSAAFAPDSTSVFLGGNAGKVSKVEIPSLISSQTYADQEGRIESLSVSPDGSMLVSYGGFGDVYPGEWIHLPTLNAYRISTGEIYWTREMYSDISSIGDIAFDPKGGSLGVGWMKWNPGWEEGVGEIGQILNTNDGSIQKWITADLNAQGDIVFDASGRYLAISVSIEKDWNNFYAARVLSSDDLVPIVNFECRVWGDNIAFNQEGKFLALSCEKGLQVYHMESLEEVAYIEFEDDKNGLDFHPGGALLVTSLGIIQVDDWSFIQEMEFGEKLIFSPDGRYLLSLSNGSAMLWGILP